MNEVGDPTVALTAPTNDGEDAVTTTVAEGLTVSNSVINVEAPVTKPPPRVVNTAHLMTHIVNPDLSDDSGKLNFIFFVVFFCLCYIV